MLAELGNDFQRYWLIGLLMLWAALLFGGFLFGKLNADCTHRIPRWARMASSFTLVVAAWSWFIFAEVFPKSYSLLIAIGMTLGFVGDLFMARLIPIKDSLIGKGDNCQSLNDVWAEIHTKSGARKQNVSTTQ